MRLSNFRSLFIEQLKDIYSSEKQIIHLLPKAVNAASSKELKELIHTHLEKTKRQMNRLEQIFSQLGESTECETCKGSHGIIKEIDDIINDHGKTEVRDAALIAFLQHFHHYQIACYGTVRSYAEHLGFKEVAKWLKDWCSEEGKFDKKLTTLAEGALFSTGINKRAKQAA